MAGMHVNQNKGWKFKWEEWEDDIIKKYYPTNGYERVLEFLPNRNKQGICGRASKIGVRYLSYNKYYFDEIDNKEKAYWLGFIYADGNVNSGLRLSITLSSVDKNHLVKFKNAIESNINLRDYQKNNYNYSTLEIKNSHLHNSLINKGVVYRKTYCAEFPTKNIVPEYLLSHFIRGFFDGDGCIYFKSDYRLRPDRKNKIYKTFKKEISICGYKYEFIKELQNILVNYGFNFKCQERKDSTLYTLRLQDSQSIIKFLNFLYKDSDNSNRLDRKYIKAQELICLLQQ
jgi:hypothetical protein